MLQLLAKDGGEERVLVVESPLAELIDQKHPAFFDAVRASLAQAVAKIDHIEYAALDEEDEDD